MIRGGAPTLFAVLALFAAIGCGDCSDPEPARPDLRSADEAQRPVDEDEGVGRRIAEVPAQTAEMLGALGYVPRLPTDNPDDRGVTLETEDAALGLNLFTSRRRARALLVDREGGVVHRWDDSREHPRAWMHVEPLPNGDLLSIVKDSNLVKHDWNSGLVWETSLPVHHDLAVRDDGHILVLVRQREQITHGGRELPVITDSVAFLTPDGEIERTVPLLPLFRDVISAGRLDRLKAALEDTSEGRLLRPGGVGDVLHTNAIEILEREIPGVAPAGAVLLSFRAASRIAIVDAEITERLWVWGRGELDGQHDPTLLANGHIMVFDNGLRRGRDSRVIDLDPVGGTVEWTYEAEGFFSRLRGGAQELSNGNILITESDPGRAFEVTRSGEQVWEFWNPDVVGQGEEANRGVIYRLNRFRRSFFEPLAQR